MVNLEANVTSPAAMPIHWQPTVMLQGADGMTVLLNDHLDNVVNTDVASKGLNAWNKSYLQQNSTSWCRKGLILALSRTRKTWLCSS